MRLSGLSYKATKQLCIGSYKGKHILNSSSKPSGPLVFGRGYGSFWWQRAKALCVESPVVELWLHDFCIVPPGDNMRGWSHRCLTWGHATGLQAGYKRHSKLSQRQLASLWVRLLNIYSSFSLFPVLQPVKDGSVLVFDSQRKETYASDLPLPWFWTEGRVISSSQNMQGSESRIFSVCSYAWLSVETVTWSFPKRL